jgi:hypothetical protein
MIGDFRRSDRADQKTIFVLMFWSGERQRCGRVVVPSRLRTRLQALNYPALDEELRLDAAVAYASFIAMRLGMSLCLKGDISVWNPAWGKLQELDHTSPVNVEIATALN